MDDQTNTAAPAQSTPDWVALARDAYSASTNWFDSSVRAQIEGDLRQFQGQHPSGSKYLADANKGRSKLFRPKTRTTIRKNEAAAAQAFFASNDVVKVTAQDEDDPAQMASAAVMGELLQHRLTKSIPWFLTLVGAYQDAQTVGVVASYQYWQYDEKKKIDRPAIRLIPIENLRIDPGADWTDPIGTSPYVIELIPMYVKDVKARMTRVDPKTGEPRWRQLSDSQIQGATKTYGDTIRLQREAPRPDSKYQQQANGNFNVVWVHKNVVEVDGVDYCYYTLGCEHLLSDPVPLEEVYFHGRRPYVIGAAVLETHKLYPSSVPRLTKDVQAEINEVANQRIDNVKLAMNKRYFARRNKQVDLRSVTRNVPGSVTLVQDIDDVKVVEFNDVTGSSYKEQEVLNLDFDDVAGTFSGSSVQSNRKLNETVGGMQMLDAGANQVSGYQLRTFVETWVEPVLRQIVLLEQYYETDDALIALCGKSAQLNQRFGMDQVTDDMLMHEFTLNVNVGMGAVNPADQVRQFVDGMTALGNMLANEGLVQLGMNVEEIVKELFGKLGYKDGARFFNFDGADPRIKQLQDQVNQLQQQLAQKVDPALIAAQIRKIDAEVASLSVKDKVTAADAVKKGSEAQFSAMQTAEVIAAVPGVAPIADELMKAAGYRPPTPSGIDPNFPQPGGPAAGLGIEAVKNRRTGIGFMPGQGASTTNMPLPPMPPTAGTGARAGIETTRPDSAGASLIARAAFADGGFIADHLYGYTGANLDRADALTGFKDRDALLSTAYNMGILGGNYDPSNQQMRHQALGQISGYVNHIKSLNKTGGQWGSSYGDQARDRFLDGQDPTWGGAARPRAPDGNEGQGYADGGLVDPNNPLNPVQQAWNGAATAMNNGVQQVASLPGRALAGYERLSNENPKTKLALDMLPGTGTVTSALDVANDVRKGQYGDAALDAIGLVPGYKLAKAPIHSAAQQAMRYIGDNRAKLDASINSIPEYVEKMQRQQQAPGYADGGLIQGPGGGTDDAIPALIDGQQPAQVSSGEYLIPAAVVAAIGQDFFDQLVAQFHQPAQGAPGDPAAMAPVGLQGGDYIIPADCVEQLGRDYFDKLVEHYTA
jgi:hypothetical protein